MPRLYGGFVITLLVFGGWRAQAQRTAPIIPVGDSTYLVIVGHDTLLAVTQRMLKEDLKRASDLKAAQDKLAIADTTISRFTEFRARSESARVKDSVMIKTLEDQVSDLKADVALHKRLLRKANPLIGADLGAGLTADGLAAIAGLGLRRARVWGTLQKDGSAVYAGIHLPLF